MARIINLRQKAEVQPEPQKNVIPPQQPIPRKEFSASAIAVTAKAPAVTSPQNLLWEALPHALTFSRRRTTFFVVGLAILAALVWNFQDNIIFAFFLLLSAVIMAVIPRHANRPVAVEIRAEGVSVDENFHPFRDLHSFWIDYTPAGIKELSLKTARWYIPYVKVPLGDQDPNEVRGFLMDFIPEKEHEVSLVEAIARLIGH